MELSEYIKYIRNAALEFGAEIKKNADERDRCGKENTVRYYAITKLGNTNTGAYSDLSYVIFPAETGEKCLITITCGTDGFLDDYELASLPGLRRGVLRIQRAYKLKKEQAGSEYPMSCKQSFVDIKCKLPCFAKNEEDLNFKKAYEKYGKYILASVMEDISQLPMTMQEIGHPTVTTAMLALYAEFREWAKNAEQRNAIINNVAEYKISPENIEKQQLKEVQKLLISRRYVVLQGAPGTGKTWLSAMIAEVGLNEKEKFSKVFFTQFHAETTYSDFVYGIEPNINDNAVSEPRFILKKGKLYEAIEEAERNQKEKGEGDAKPVLLLVDEINRGNLSNVLGEALFLFENNPSDRNYHLNIGKLKLSKLPENLYVLATMNTSDRSLAVIDFALRRRFAWYTMKPHELDLSNDPSLFFDSVLFEKFAAIFDKYATDEELSLQPGQSYFVTKQEKHKELIDARMQYELMPLIKEYLNEGYLVRAKSEFCNLFFNEAGLDLYE